MPQHLNYCIDYTVTVPAQMKKEEKEVKEKSEAAQSQEYMRGMTFANSVTPEATYYPNGWKEQAGRVILIVFRLKIVYNKIWIPDFR